MRWLAAWGALVIVGLGAAPAVAMPGDPPIEPLAPLQGTSVPANADGVTVSFRCPPYNRRAPDVFGSDPGTVANYEAAFGPSAAVGADGRLAERVAIGRVAERPGEPGVCDAVLGANAFPPPQSTPGTYFWQAWRDCGGCDALVETGPVVQFRIAAAGRPTLKAPRRAYAGFPFVVAVAYPGASGAGRLQRRVGGGWRTITTTPGDGEPIVTLPRGSQQLRVVFAVGSDTVTSGAARVDVRPARRWSTGRADDGTYRDAARPSVRFRVAGGGRRITGFRADVPTLCGGTNPNVGTIALPAVRIAPDGGFAIARTSRGVTMRLVGRLVDGRLRGARATLRTTGCSGSIAVAARRADA